MQIPADPNQVKDISGRLRKLFDKSAPEGLPKNKENQDRTNPDFPLQHNTPKDPGWINAYMITGSGVGPEIL